MGTALSRQLAGTMLHAVPVNFRTGPKSLGVAR